ARATDPITSCAGGADELMIRSSSIRSVALPVPPTPNTHSPDSSGVSTVVTRIRASGAVPTPGTGPNHTKDDDARTSLNAATVAPGANVSSSDPGVPSG